MSDQDPFDPLNNSHHEIIKAYEKNYKFFKTQGGKIAFIILRESFPELPPDVVRIEAEYVVDKTLGEIEKKILERNSESTVEWQGEERFRGYFHTRLKWRIQDHLDKGLDKFADIDMQLIPSSQSPQEDLLKSEYHKLVAIKCIKCLTSITEVKRNGKPTDEARYAQSMLDCLKGYSKTSSTEALCNYIQKTGVLFDLTSDELRRCANKRFGGTAEQQGQLIFRVRRRLAACLIKDCESETDN